MNNINSDKYPHDPMEEFVKRVHKFFHEFFKGFFSNGNIDGDSRVNLSDLTKPFGLGISIIFGIIFILTSFYTVDFSEEAIVTRFDRYHKTASPGLHFKLPFFIDRVIKVPSKVLLEEEFGFRSLKQQGGRTKDTNTDLEAESLMLTGDLKVADLKWVLQYRISDARKFLFHTRNAQKNIRNISVSIMRRVVGDRLEKEILSTGRVNIAEKARILTQEVLDKHGLGITIVSVVLQDISPPEVVKVALNKVNLANQEQKKAIIQAKSLYNNRIPNAKAKAELLISEAKVFADSLIKRAKFDAANFNLKLIRYRQAPVLTRRLLYLEAMEEIYANFEKVVIIDNKLKGVLSLSTEISKISQFEKASKFTSLKSSDLFNTKELQKSQLNKRKL